MFKIQSLQITPASVFLNAGKEAGYKYIEDINQHDNEGFGPCPQTISKGYRASTSFSFLNPIKDRKI